MGITENSCFGNQTDLNKLFGATYTAEFISQGFFLFDPNQLCKIKIVKIDLRNFNTYSVTFR